MVVRQYDIGFLDAHGTGEPITWFVVKLYASGRKKAGPKLARRISKIGRLHVWETQGIQTLT